MLLAVSFPHLSELNFFLALGCATWVLSKTGMGFKDFATRHGFLVGVMVFNVVLLIFLVYIGSENQNLRSEIKINA